MDKATFETYLDNRYKSQLEFYKASAVKYQKKYKTFQLILIIFSALTPVLAALNSAKTPIIGGISGSLNLSILISSTIVAILTTVLKRFNYQQLWIAYRSILEKLKPEIHYYDFKIGPYAAANEDLESLFVKRVEGILSTDHSQWLATKIDSNKEYKIDPNEQWPNK